MRTLTTLLLIALFTTTSYGISSSTNHPLQTFQETITIPTPTITTTDTYTTITLAGTTTELRTPGHPIIPYLTHTYTFPQGTTIQTITVTTPPPTTTTLTNIVQPAPTPIFTNYDPSPVVQHPDPAIYTNTTPYPDHTYDYTIKHGAHNIIYLTLTLYPIRYHPANHTLESDTQATITITYHEPTTPPTPASAAYDLLIIAPKTFTPLLQPLLLHRTTLGTKTLLKTTEDIYRTYPGRDAPEKIKRCIAAMNQTYGITTVLLVGGRRGQLFGWYIPERLTHNDDGWETGYASDLYYADLYKYNATTGTTEFDDWDSNHNNIIGEWNNDPAHRDIIDHIPDVTVGRLACVYPAEVTTVVNKILSYENTGNATWLKHMICVAGDTFVPGINGDHTGIPEGELECNQAAAYVQPQGFTITRLYTSDGSFTTSQDVVDAFSRGAGLVMFSGHGNPSTWGTHAPDSDEFIAGLSLKTMTQLKNNDKLPVVVVGGCHNSQFNVTMRQLPSLLLRYALNHANTRLFYMEWVPECWSWRLVSMQYGGAIATIGSTGLGYGDIGTATLQHRSGWLNSHFFSTCANQTTRTLGQAWAQTITNYITQIGGDNTNQIDRKSIEEWTLFGDPSLSISGRK